MTKNIMENAMVSYHKFLSKKCVISVLFYDTFYLQAKVSPLKLALVEIILLKINRRGGWSKNVLGGKFVNKYLGGGGTSTRHPRVYT